jgi:aryl-alcohol dehydrogenase-like predicted oxidoreductase
MTLTTLGGAALTGLALGAREDGYPAGVARALRGGVNFFFLYQLGAGRWAAALRDVLHPQRDDVAIGAGSGSRRPAGLRTALARYRDALGAEVIDVFFAEYVHPGDDLDAVFGDDGALAELSRWKEQGAIRYVGATAHDRALSRRLAEDPRVEVLMQRYNMAHRKAEDEVFPACREHDTAVIAFTATRWGSLLRGHRDWDEAPPSALDCYRFAAAHTTVDVVLAAPQSDAELDENLELLTAPAMSPTELERWRRYGDLVYGDGTGSFETSWP